MVDRVDLDPSIDSDHVTILCQVMAGSPALETMYSHSSVMYSPVPVSRMCRITGYWVGNDTSKNITPGRSMGFGRLDVVYRRYMCQ